MTKSNGANYSQTVMDWTKLEGLSSHLSQSGLEPGTVPHGEWQIIEQALRVFVNEQKGLAPLQLLDQYAIQAARHLGDKRELGHLLGSKGHNLHRQGYHQAAINVFDESAKNYREMG